MSIAMSDLKQLTSDTAELGDGELEIEDVSFLPGGSSAGAKRSVYEPTSSQKCQQLVCSKARAVLIVSTLIIFAIIIAVIAAFARPSFNNGCISNTTRPLQAPNPTTVPVDTNGKPFPWQPIRLPTTITPVSYNLLLNPNLTTFTFTGEMSIVMEVKEATNFIVLHVSKLSISAFELLTSDGDNVAIASNMETLDHQQVYLGLGEQLNQGHTYLLRIQYSGILSEGLTGFYRSSYKDEHDNIKWIATTHFEPTDARTAFPCFDEPQLKANFTISIVRELQHIALSNTDIQSSRPYPTNSSSLVVDQFHTSVKMSTYLVAFIVCDFKNITRRTATNQIRVSVFSPSNMIDQTAYGLEVATTVLDFYENEYFHIPYPMSKSDQIAIPDFSAGAMENWGLIVYLLRSLLYKNGTSSVRDKQWVATVVAHELAHQWFGNLVTMEWWNDLWLNEGFANFMEYKGVNKAEPDWKMLDLFLDETLILGMYSDGLRSSHPISVPVHDPTEINQIFDSISYKKGASIIRMLEAFLGEDTFVRGIRRYLGRHSYGNAKTQDLWEALSEQSVEEKKGVNVTTVMDTWTQQMGYPVVMVTRKGSKFTVSQERFLFNPRSNQSEEFKSSYNYKWNIPLTYVTSDDPGQLQLKWMDKRGISFDVPGDPGWVKFNVKMTGFYRVSYDTATWSSLTNRLLSDHTVLTPADRTGLLEDVFSLARSGHVDIVTALNMSRYLSGEKEYVPLKTGLDGLWYVGKMLEYSQAYSLFKEYVTSLINGSLGDILWKPESDHLTVYLQTLLLGRALEIGEPGVVRKIKDRFQKWKQGSDMIPDFKLLVYGGGVKYGDEDDWEFVWGKYCETNVATEKSTLLSALSSTTDTILLQRLLEEALNGPNIRQTDTVYVISSVASTPTGRILAWRFVKQHWDTLYSKFHGMTSKFSRMLMGTTGHFTTQYDYDEVKDFLMSKMGGSDVRAVSQSLERIEMNVDWIQRNHDPAVNWLKRLSISSS